MRVWLLQNVKEGSFYGATGRKLKSGRKQGQVRIYTRQQDAKAILVKLAKYDLVTDIVIKEFELKEVVNETVPA